jgi:hypothetical protein
MDPDAGVQTTPARVSRPLQLIRAGQQTPELTLPYALVSAIPHDHFYFDPQSKRFGLSLSEPRKNGLETQQLRAG